MPTITTTNEKGQLTTEQAWGRGGLMALAAFRYCLGRSTYIVSDCADWLIANWQAMPEGTRHCIQREVEEAIKRDEDARERREEYLPLGHDCDRAEWLRVRALWTDAL